MKSGPSRVIWFLAVGPNHTRQLVLFEQSNSKEEIKSISHTALLQPLDFTGQPPTISSFSHPEMPQEGPSSFRCCFNSFRALESLPWDLTGFLWVAGPVRVTNGDTQSTTTAPPAKGKAKQKDAPLIDASEVHELLQSRIAALEGEKTLGNEEDKRTGEG